MLSLLVYALFPAKCKEYAKKSKQLQAAITGFFAVFRVTFQLGKPLLIGAAIHNLCEVSFSFIFSSLILHWRVAHAQWFMVAWAYCPDNNSRRTMMIASACWVWFVISTVIVIPTFPFFALAEQATGIMLDFALPIVWYYLWKRTKESKNNEKTSDGKKRTKVLADMYLIFLMAHCLLSCSFYLFIFVCRKCCALW